MEELRKLLVAAKPTVRWFALTVGRRISDEIGLSVQEYLKDKADPQKQRRMVTAAKSAATFLWERATEEAKHHATAIRSQLKALGEK